MQTASLKPRLTFLVDTREQLPLTFASPRRTEFSDGGVSRVCLAEGDYSVAIDGGEALPIRLERKSLSDLYGVIGGGRERFERELERLTRHEYRAILVEGSFSDVARGAAFSRVHPSSALGSLCTWSARYQLAIWFCESHARAGEIAQRLLEAFAVDTLRGVSRSGAAVAPENETLWRRESNSRRFEE